jgi:hypothetical protein
MIFIALVARGWREMVDWSRLVAKEVQLTRLSIRIWLMHVTPAAGDVQGLACVGSSTGSGRTGARSGDVEGYCSAPAKRKIIARP